MPQNPAGISRSAAQARGIAFFRQSGWMVIATGLGGLCMWLVHSPAQATMSKSEYGVFLALLQVLNLMLIPSLALQSVFAQQAAGAINAELQAQLASTSRRVLAGVFVLWLGMAGLGLLFQGQVISTLKIANPAVWWITIFVGLAMLSVPIVQGLLQGRQDFFWLGGLQILNGCGRFFGVLLLVWGLGLQSLGAMIAALTGFWVAGVVAAWQTRSLWLGHGVPIQWRDWFARVIPLTLGLGAGQFMMAADQILVQSIFDKDVTPLYGAPGMIGRALIFFTAAVLSVMFPKIVESAARAEKTNVLVLALGATAALGGLAALACTVLPELPLRIIYGKEYWVAAPLVPWFAWCMLPLTLSNVLIGNLLARQRWEAVPYLVLVAAGYAAALMGRSLIFQEAEQFAAFRMVVRTLGLFSLLLLFVSLWFTLKKDASTGAETNPACGKARVQQDAADATIDRRANRPAASGSRTETTQKNSCSG